MLTFPASATGLPWSFTVGSPGSGGFVYNDSTAWNTGTLSPGGFGFGNGNDDDVVITITGGPDLYGFGFEILDNQDRNDVETVKVFGAGDTLLATLDLPARTFSNDNFFIGITSSEPIVRIEFDEDSLGNDIAIRDFHFAGIANGTSPLFTVEVKLDGGTYRVLDPDDRHDFGSLPIGQSSACTFRVTNVGDSPLTLPAVGLVPGDPDSPFAYEGGLGELAPGAAEEFDVSFAPLAVADTDSVLRVSYAETGLGRSFRIRGTGRGTTTPRTLYVRLGAAGAGDGSSWADAFPHLQDALAAANYGDAIWIAEGTYFPDLGGGQIGDDRTSSFALVDGAALYGGFPDSGTPGFADRDPAAHVTILSGDIDQDDGSGGNNSGNAYHVITAHRARPDTRLDGLTITGGNADAPDEPDGNQFGSSGGASPATMART
ncbi:MAG: hypothetical protein R3F11_12410 [Verrucomicrobiales bacterium]